MNGILSVLPKPCTTLIRGLLCSVVMGLAGPVFSAAPSAASSGTLETQAFLSKVSASGWLNREAATRALEISANPAVKEFAQRMVYDQARLDDQLAEVARKRQLNLPAMPDAERAAVLQTLRDKTGLAFDEAYGRYIRQDRLAMADLMLINLLNPDTEVAVYASYFMPLVQHHARLARQLPGAGS